MNARPTDRLAIAVAQLNPIVGDIAGNADKARQARAQAARAGADLVALPELFLSGYPPEDLVLKPALQAACRVAGQFAIIRAESAAIARVSERLWSESRRGRMMTDRV